MVVEAQAELAVSRIAAAIGEPARTRILYSLLDGRARTSTELATIAEVSPSTASVHLNRLRTDRLVKLSVQGKHRYYGLQGVDVAHALEALHVLGGDPRSKFISTAPAYLRAARTCYDHIAGTLGVQLCDRLKALGWLSPSPNGRGDEFQISSRGSEGLGALGIQLVAMRKSRRRFAFACLDWSERRSHLGGAVGAVLLDLALKKKWLVRDPGSRALSITNFGRREMLRRLGLKV
jgi:DNA-binding transcriptional ArsR family regulator